MQMKIKNCHQELLEIIRILKKIFEINTSFLIINLNKEELYRFQNKKTYETPFSKLTSSVFGNIIV